MLYGGFRVWCWWWAGIEGGGWLWNIVLVCVSLFALCSGFHNEACILRFLVLGRSPFR